MEEGHDQQHSGLGRNAHGSDPAQAVSAGVDRLEAPVVQGGLRLRYNPDRAPGSAPPGVPGSVLGLDRLAKELRATGGEFGPRVGGDSDGGLRRDTDGFLVPPPPRARPQAPGVTERSYRERGSDTPSHAGGVNHAAVVAISERMRAADSGGIAASTAGSGREGVWREAANRADEISEAGSRGGGPRRGGPSGGYSRDGGYPRDSDRYSREGDRYSRDGDRYSRDGDRGYPREGDRGGGGGSSSSSALGVRGRYAADRGGDAAPPAAGGVKRSRPDADDGGRGGGDSRAYGSSSSGGGGASVATGTTATLLGGSGSGRQASRFGAERTPLSAVGTPASVVLLDDGEGVYSAQRRAPGGAADARGRRSVSVSVSSRIQQGWGEGDEGGRGRPVGGAWEAMEAGGGAGDASSSSSAAARQLLAREEGDSDFDRNFYDADEATLTADASDPSAGGLIVENEKTAAMESRVEAARGRGEMKLRGMSARKSALHADQQARWAAAGRGGGLLGATPLFPAAACRPGSRTGCARAVSWRGRGVARTRRRRRRACTCSSTTSSRPSSRARRPC